VPTARKSCGECVAMCVAVCVAVQTAHKSSGESFNRTGFYIWVQGTQILAIHAELAEVTIILAPLYGPTMLVF